MNRHGLVHGFDLVNGFNAIGPQLTLYCPGPILKKSTNEVIILESDGVSGIDHISMDDTPQRDIIPRSNRYVELNHESW